MNDDALIDDNTVARMYGIARGTVWHWLKAGKIPAPKRMGPRYTRWLESEILEDIRNVKHEATAEAAR